MLGDYAVMDDGSFQMLDPGGAIFEGQLQMVLFHVNEMLRRGLREQVRCVDVIEMPDLRPGISIEHFEAAWETFGA